MEILPLVFPVMYAEMHYRLRGFSLLYRKWPEIISDAPFRLEPGKDIPLIILMKDCHQFPVKLLRITATCCYGNVDIETHNIYNGSKFLESPVWWTIFHIPVRNGFSGPVSIETSFRVQNKKGETLSFMTDNYTGSSHLPLTVYVAKDPLPRFRHWYLGDLHYHSMYTEDQVEFGAPLRPTAEVARALGLSFAGVTDHSYDLDDRTDDYLTSDPLLPKWKKLHAEIQSHDSRDFIFFPGEEVSCGNHRGKNVHLLVLNNTRFFHGSGDSAEKWFRTQPENDIASILQNKEDSSLAFAAHPEVPFPPLHWILLRRGKWHIKDYRHAGLDGLQILNGHDDRAFKRGIKSWIKLLCEGRKLTIVAGNDAHGSFNRFRQLSIPFVRFIERQAHVFGAARTGVYLRGTFSRDSIIKAIQQRRCIITTGPVMELKLVNENGDTGVIGSDIRGRNFTLMIDIKTSGEFGNFQRLRIWTGQPGSHENLFKEILLDTCDHSFNMQLNFDPVSHSGYCRGEVFTLEAGKQFFCMTNPIWYNSSDE